MLQKQLYSGIVLIALVGVFSFYSGVGVGAGRVNLTRARADGDACSQEDIESIAAAHNSCTQAANDYLATWFWTVIAFPIYGAKLMACNAEEITALAACAGPLRQD